MTTSDKDRAWGDIKLQDRGTYCVLRIDREAKRNAMNRAARQGLMQAFAHAKDRYPVIVITGVGQSFCAGIDLKERAEDLARGDNSGSGEWIDVNIAIREHSSIFIAAVNGIALGGGATLINVCDLAIAADTVEIGMPEMGFATYPGMAGPSTQLTLPRKRVAWMMLTTDRIPAQTALEWGMVNQVVPLPELLPAAEAVAERVSKFNAFALAGAKQALDHIPATTTDWRQAFKYGEMVNARIQLRTANAKAHAERQPKDSIEGKPGSGR